MLQRVNLSSDAKPINAPFHVVFFKIYRVHPLYSEIHG